MALILLSEFQDDLISQVARIHQDSLGYRSVITFFGVGFLKGLYRVILDEKIGFFILSVENSKVRGFLIGLPDPGMLMLSVKKKWYAFFYHVCWGLIRRPWLLLKLVQLFLYPGKTNKECLPELLVIAVDSSCRGRGIGAGLVRRMEEILQERGFGGCKVTVHQEMIGANHFYKEQGFARVGSFNLLDVKWNLYEKRFERK